MTTTDDFAAWLRTRTSNPHVIARILRLNPDPQEGAYIRGWRDADRWRHLWQSMHFLTRNEVIRRHGRAAWDAIPARFIRRQGRRQWVPAVHIRKPEHRALPGGKAY